MVKIVIKKYDINCDLNKKIVLISDIHYYSKKDIKRLNKVLFIIKNINPNYICITGDIIDKQNINDFDMFISWLTQLSKICKVIISLGNHEFYGNLEKKLNTIYLAKISNINNIYLLNNKSVKIDNINFIGLLLPITHYSKYKEDINDFKKYIKNIKVDKNSYNILLCHSPINISKKEILKNIDVDLILCGHMHGGIVPRILRFMFGKYGLISPYKKLFPKNAYGIISYNNKNVIITSGIKVLSESHMPRLTNLFASEVVEINLKK